ncbi:MAG TPA: OmpA family protein [Terriglobales bacterium]|jgi:outer membrane protein OmpA-like peptidoglycan-associated protein|nr:OmpA family protein [Terriglobales bacterium]
MTSKILLTLPLAAALTVPGWAQQAPASSSSQTPQTDQSQSTPTPASDQQNAQAYPNAHEPLTYEPHEGFWGHLNPFARKKYVQKQLDPVRGRLNELDEITAQNAKAIKDVDARAQEGIRVASLKANEADMHAIDAGNRAQLAHQTAQQATVRLNTVEHVVDNIDQYQAESQAEIHFKPGQVGLSPKAKLALDEMATPLKDQKGYIIEVQGFSTGTGQAAIQNSQQMAQSVVRYLVLKHDIPVYRIYTIGMGNASVPTSAEGATQRMRGGRVEISLMRNGAGDLEEPASQSQPEMK